MAIEDPVNRFVRYPLARLLVRGLVRTPIRPTHVTATHLAVGLAGAVLVWRGSWVGAFACLEMRMVLDCADGVLARTKGLSSAAGRAFDELADAAAYVALIVAVGAQLGGFAIATALLAVGTLCALGYDWYRKADAGAGAGAEADAGAEAGAEENATWGAAFGRWFERWQRRFFGGTRAPPRGVVALLSWDNGLTILHLGILTGHLREASLVAIGFGLFTLVLARSTS